MSIDKLEKEKKYNHLAAAEMGEEENYNMIDGVINNTPKPSVLEQMKEYERRITENSNDSTEADENEPKTKRPSRVEK